MNGEYVVDASVAAKWFLSEPDSEKAVTLLREATLIAPALIAVEVSAAITRRHRSGALDVVVARRMLFDARATFQRPRVELVADDKLLESASEIALELRHPVQDCLYLACGKHFGVDMLTADQTLLKRAAVAYPFVRAF